MGLGDLMKEELDWGRTENGALARTTTKNECLNFFGRIGSLRGSTDIAIDLFRKAYAEDSEIAMKLLFFTRDIREGYGERSAFTEILRDLANRDPLTVVKNLPYIMEFGRYKDLYCLVGTPCEKAMFKEMRNQWEKDLTNLEEGKEISLLAKWIATPGASSKATAHLAVKTAYGLGYNKYTIKKFRKDLNALRNKLNITEKHIASKEYDKIDYSKVASQCNLVYKDLFYKYDEERYKAYLDSVSRGEEKINTGTLTPVDIVHKVFNCLKEYDKAYDVMWDNLQPPKHKGNVLCMVDTSGSMFSGRGNVKPIEASIAMGLYLAEHNTGDMKNLIMTFSEEPEFVCLTNRESLADKIMEISKTNWGYNTDLHLAYEKILDLAKSNNMPQEDMPEAFIIISDMQIDSADRNNYREGKLDFHTEMKKMYEDAGYKMPHTVYWNVNAERATFHAAMSEDSVSLVSGYSPNVFNQIMDNIGKTPLDLMMSIANSERYKDIHSYKVEKSKMVVKMNDLEIENKHTSKLVTKTENVKRKSVDELCI